MTAEIEGVGDDGEWIDWLFDPWLVDFLAVKAVAEPTPSPLTRVALAEAQRLINGQPAHPPRLIHTIAALGASWFGVQVGYP